MSVANTESSMTLSQSMDSVNTVAEEEVSRARDLVWHALFARTRLEPRAPREKA